jgi:hypothetical protein
MRLKMENFFPRVALQYEKNLFYGIFRFNFLLQSFFFVVVSQTKVDKIFY